MSYYYYFFLLLALSIIIFLIRSYILRKKSISSELFIEALRSENDGHFEAAVVTYKNALDEVKKNRFRSGLEDKIIAKIKLLHIIIEYKNSFR